MVVICMQNNQKYKCNITYYSYEYFELLNFSPKLKETERNFN